MDAIAMIRRCAERSEAPKGWADLSDDQQRQVTPGFGARWEFESPMTFTEPADHGVEGAVPIGQETVLPFCDAGDGSEAVLYASFGDCQERGVA